VHGGFHVQAGQDGERDALEPAVAAGDAGVRADIQLGGDDVAEQAALRGVGQAKRQS
jgi:hypothetical protein